MTRINVGILPQELPSILLLAELREIKRIPNTIHKSNTKDIPNVFTLGSGHVRFFYDKGLYTHRRYISLYNEAIKRGYNVQDFSNSWDNYPNDLYNDYKEKLFDRNLIIKRINEKGFVLLQP